MYIKTTKVPLGRVSREFSLQVRKLKSFINDLLLLILLFQRSSGLGSSSMVDPLKYSSTSLGLSSPLSRREESSSSSSVQTKSYSSSSSAVDGGRPHHSSHTDSVSRTTRSNEVKSVC